MQPTDRVSRLIVHRGMFIESGLSGELFITSLSVETRESEADISADTDPWYADTHLCIMSSL